MEIVERRVETLENFIKNIDRLLIEGYGLKKHCMKPSVAHGHARCPKKLAPRSKEMI